MTSRFLIALFMIVLSVSKMACIMEPKSRSIGAHREAGARAAVEDLRNGHAVYYVFYEPKVNETFSSTAIRLRSAGSNAATPERAAYVLAYNQVIERYLESKKASD